MCALCTSYLSVASKIFMLSYLKFQRVCFKIRINGWTATASLLSFDSMYSLISTKCYLACKNGPELLNRYQLFTGQSAW